MIQVPQTDTPAELPTTQGTDPVVPQKGAKKTKTNPERLSLLKARLKVAQAWAKNPHAAWKKWIGQYEIENIKDTDDVRDHVNIGYIFRKVESDQPTIFDDQPDLFIKGRKANVKQIEPVIEGLYDYLWDVQDMEELIEQAGLYFSLLGMGYVVSPWTTKTKTITQSVQTPVLDETGQPTLDEQTGQPNMVDEDQEYEVPTIDNPEAYVPDVFKIFFSPETKFAPILDYEHCPYYFEERTMTPEAIKARFGVSVDSTESLKIDDVDAQSELDTVAAPIAKDDLKRVKVYEYYGCLPEDMAPGKSDWEYDKDYHIFLTKSEELLVEENPYPNKPLFILANYGLANKFWKFGEAKHLLHLVQELEMYRTQILQHTRKMANPHPLIQDTAVTAEVTAALQDPRVGRPIVYPAGSEPPTYLSPANLGREVEAGIGQVRQDLEKESGSFDLASGSNQSTVRSPAGIHVYSQAADKNVQRKRKKVARFIRAILIFQFQLVAANWKPEDEHTLAVVGPTGTPQDLQVDAQVLQVIGGVQQYYNLDIEVESLSVNKQLIREDALNLWGLAKESPDIFNLPEVAKWLLQSGFNMKDGDRFLTTDQQRQQMAQAKAPPPSVSVSIKADATTPPGAALLENEGLLKPGQGQQAVVDNQVMQVVAGQHQAQQQIESGQAQAATQLQSQQVGNALNPQPTQPAAKGGPSNGQ